MTYAEKLKDPRWQKKRLEILQRDKFKCKLCGDDETTLHVHHKEYANTNPWNYPNTNFITLCEHCHHDVEYLKKEEGIDLANIRGCYKSDGWTNGCRIIFISHDEGASMRIFNKKNEFIVGFGLNDDTIRNVVRTLKKALV